MDYLVYFTTEDSSGMPSPEGMAEMGRIMAEAFESGIIRATGQIPPMVTHVRLESGEISTTEADFIDGKAFIPGFTIIEASSQEDAVAWATKLRRCMGDGVIRVAALSASGPEAL